MSTIHCHIGGRDYRLDYDATPIVTGMIYRGTVYLDRVLDFHCEVPEGPGDILFFPGATRKELRDAVLNAIVEHEHG